MVSVHIYKPSPCAIIYRSMKVMAQILRQKSGQLFNEGGAHIKERTQVLTLGCGRSHEIQEAPYFGHFTKVE